MSSIYVRHAKSVKYFGVITCFILPALPALVMPLFASRWHPPFNAGEFPGAVFYPETVAAYSIDEHNKPPNITTVSEGPRPGLPADLTPPGEIAGAFYHAIRENSESAHGSGLPLPGESTGPPDDAAGPAAEPDGGTGGKTGGIEEGEWQLLGFIRDSAGIEHRYFKEKENGKIVTVINTPESFPANTEPAEGGNR